MAYVTIRYLNRKESAPAYTDIWEGQVDIQGEPGDVLEAVFARFNGMASNDANPPVYPRSMSVGDLVTVDGVEYCCSPIGWNPTGNTYTVSRWDMMDSL